ncbi:MAG: hypothetical protein SGBAC_012050 [Bacillariaceae sp.]
MLSSDWETLSHNELLEQKGMLQSRLDAIEVSDLRRRSTKNKTASVDGIPYKPKVDNHWDFLMKEMMWLGADFQGERKRQLSLAKKCASSVKQYHKTKETRRLKELQNAVAKQRRLGAKIGRDIKSWWSKIDRVISYKQKLQADEQQERAMNEQLVLLMQQTERYSTSLTDSGDVEASDSYNNLKDYDVTMKNKSNGQWKRLTIEAALATERKRKSKERVRDYARMQLEDAEFYGESTVPHAASDASYEPESDIDDESTIKAAMDDELLYRIPNKKSSEHVVFKADPLELSRLHEEAEMEIERVIMRFRSEGEFDVATEEEGRENVNGRGKQVRFRQEEIRIEETDSGKSPFIMLNTVKDVDLAVDGIVDEEFSDHEPEVDDETTIAAEESLPQNMTAQQEIALLEDENKISIGDLRKLYCGTPNGSCVEESSVNEGMSMLNDLETTQNDSATEAEDLTAEEEKMFKKSVELLTEKWKTKNMLRSGGSENEASGSLDEAGPIATIQSTPRREFLDVFNATDANAEDAENEEYEPLHEKEADDETTIAAEEKLGRDISYEDEKLIPRKQTNQMNSYRVQANIPLVSTATTIFENEGESQVLVMGIEVLNPNLFMETIAHLRMEKKHFMHWRHPQHALEQLWLVDRIC